MKTRSLVEFVLVAVVLYVGANLYLELDRKIRGLENWLTHLSEVVDLQDRRLDHGDVYYEGWCPEEGRIYVSPSFECDWAGMASYARPIDDEGWEFTVAYVDDNNQVVVEVVVPQPPLRPGDHVWVWQTLIHDWPDARLPISFDRNVPATFYDRESGLAISIQHLGGEFEPFIGDAWLEE